jgi:hypothetical protein
VLADRQRPDAQPGEPPDPDDPDEWETREWSFEGSGYRTAGDICLARNLEEELRVGRRIAREDQGAGPVTEMWADICNEGDD